MFTWFLGSLGDLLSYLLSNQGYHIGFSFVLPKLYSNAVMSSLNSRRPDVNINSGWENNSDDPDIELSVVSNHSISHTQGRSVTMNMTASQQLQNTVRPYLSSRTMLPSSHSLFLM